MQKSDYELLKPTTRQVDEEEIDVQDLRNEEGKTFKEKVSF